MNQSQKRHEFQSVIWGEKLQDANAALDEKKKINRQVICVMSFSNFAVGENISNVEDKAAGNANVFGKVPQ